MDIEQFLARVVGPGNYIAITHKDPAQHFMAQRFFQRDDLRGAVGYLKWASAKGYDAYFALAGFSEAHQDGVDARGQPKFKGERTHENAYALRCFWIDADVRRVGDKKGANVYETRRDAATWLIQFLNATDLPSPNLRADSGYGFHWYWVLEDAMDRASWQLYADALKAAIVANGFKCEAGISSDSARILRPPETLNCKGGARVPVRAMAGSRGDYPNELVLAKLQPYLGIASTTVAGPVALAGGGPAAAFAGVAGQPSMNAAARANIDQKKHSFTALAGKCEQVKQSMAAGGNGDPYQLWYLGFLSLAHHCRDGADFVHPISQGDPRYAAAVTDQFVARIAAEKARKNGGPPRCTSFDIWRPGVCQLCPHHGKVTSPWTLGVDGDDGDLPKHYRRNQGTLQRWVERADGASLWLDFLNGDVYGPVLDRLPQGGYAISFTYERAGRRFPVRAINYEIPTDAKGTRSYFGPQHIDVDRVKAPLFGDFLVAWIESLRNQGAERTDDIPPFGYAKDSDGEYIGVAVGGTLYRSDGTTDAAPGADARIVNGFRPKGSMAKWRQAFDMVSANRPDLQVLLAASFGAPLMRFTKLKGLVISAWSQGSAVGKSSALQVGQAVWSAPKFMSSLDDTDNYANDKTATTRFLPSYWDEMRVGQDATKRMVNQIFAVVQGREKGRLRSDLTHREMREWETLVLLASNAPIMDHVVANVGTTDAGAVRLFEYNITASRYQKTSAAARVIGEVQDNYGHAGRAFIAWLAAHIAEADKMVAGLQEILERDLRYQPEERLYIAGIACILVGARIATRAGIAQFDVTALYAFLKARYFELRAARQANLPTNNGVQDVEQVISRFVSDFMGDKMITTRLSRQGKPAPDFKVVWPPMSQRKVEIHIALAERIMRINRHTFATWCRRAGFNALDTIKQVEDRLGAASSKETIAGGTGFAGGRLPVLDIPLTNPSMQGYMDVPNMGVQAVMALPTPPVPGNQVKA